MTAKTRAISKSSKPVWTIFNASLYAKRIRPNLIVYLFLLPAVIYALIFMYYPIYGIQIAFKDYNPGLGIMDSPWVGLKHFNRFFDSYLLWKLLWNTLSLSLYTFLAGMPIPIILALAFNYCHHNRFRKLVQTVTYAPHFISVVVLVGMMVVFLSPNTGIVNVLIRAFGGEPVAFLTSEGLFRHLYVWSGVWQGAGWSTIIYMAALSGVSPELHEVAIVEGASKFKRVWHVDIPVLLPTFIILQIMSLGHIMGVGFEKVYLMQNPGNAMVSEVISTYTYKLGIQGGEFSYTSAIGLFNNVINLVLLLVANGLSRRISKIGVI